MNGGPYTADIGISPHTNWQIKTKRKQFFQKIRQENVRNILNKYKQKL